MDCKFCGKKVDEQSNYCSHCVNNLMAFLKPQSVGFESESISTDEIFKGISKGDAFVLKYVYKNYFPWNGWLVTQNSGSKEDAEDVFQEAIIVLYKRIKKAVIELNTSLEIYLYSVCRHIWIHKLKERKIDLDNFTDYKAFVDVQENMDEIAEEMERFKHYQRHFKSLSSDCQQILRLSHKKEPEELIAKKFGLSSHEDLKKKIKHCKEILVKRINNDVDYNKRLQGRLRRR